MKDKLYKLYILIKQLKPKLDMPISEIHMFAR